MYDFIVIGSGLAAKISLIFLSSLGYNIAHLCPSTTIAKKPRGFEPKHFVVLNHKTLRRLSALGVCLKASCSQALLEYGLYSRGQEVLSISASSLSLPELGRQVEVGDLATSLQRVYQSGQQVTQYTAPITDLYCDPVGNRPVQVHLESQISLSAQYLIMANGLSCPWEHVLPKKISDRELFLGQGALKGSLELKTGLMKEEKAYQICLGEFLMGLIPRGMNKATVVLTGDKEKLDKAIASQEALLALKTKVLKYLPFPMSIEDKLDFQTSILSLHSSSLQQSLYDKYAFVGLSAESLHPAGAMGLNFIVDKAAVFSYFLQERGKNVSAWKMEYEDVMKKKYDSLCFALQGLTSPQFRSLLPAMRLQVFPAHCLEFFIA